MARSIEELRKQYARAVQPQKGMGPGAGHGHGPGGRHMRAKGKPAGGKIQPDGKKP